MRKTSVFGSRKVNRYLKFSHIIFFLIVLFYANVYSQSPSFPTNHWVYEYLNRLQTKGLIKEFLPGTKPFTRNQIASILTPILKNWESQSQLNSTELDQLNYLKFEFKEELSDFCIDVSQATDQRLHYLRKKTFFKKILPDFLFQNDRNLFSIQSENLLLNADFVLFYDVNGRNFSFKKDRTLVREKHGISIWGKWGKYVQYYFDFRDASEIGGEYPENDPNWSFERVGFASVKGNKVSFDEANSGLFLGKKFWQIMIGKEKNIWGPGRFGNLMLSDWATSYDQVKLQLRWTKIQFTAFTGFLRSYPPLIESQYFTGEYYRQVSPNKYIAAHRLEFAPHHRLILGLQETLIYGERNLELAYLNPINFYWSAEHHLGDQDNSALGLDFTWFPGFNLKFYGELFLDDLQTGKLGTDWYGNKWALLAGVSAIDLANVSNLDFHFEWSRLRPFVYTHRFPINVYKHFTSLLGHWAGPNSETFFMEVDYRYSKYLLFESGFQYWKHGANPPDKNVGGDLNSPHGVGDPANQKAFGGDLEKRSTIWINISYELFRNAYMEFGFSNHKVVNFLNDVNEQVDGSGNEWRMRLSWNY